MNELAKRLWIAALRSDDYKQARRALRDGGGFCCLGVLCDIYRQHEGGQWMGMFFITGDNTRSMVHLPAPVATWAGLEQKNPEIGDRDAIMLNDSGLTFAEIADRIEKYL